MKCNKCNKEIPDNSKFCLHCGAKVDILDGIVCKCGYKNPLDAIYCTECGKKLGFSKPSQTEGIFTEALARLLQNKKCGVPNAYKKELDLLLL